MRLVIDPAICQGHGRCEDLAPDLFEVGEDGLGHVLPQSKDQDSQKLIEEAIIRCPVGAIRVEPE